jgi:hypothetical protein
MDLVSLLLNLAPSKARLRLAVSALTEEQKAALTPLGAALPADMILHRLGKRIDLMKDGFKDDSWGPSQATSTSPEKPFGQASGSGRNTPGGRALPGASLVATAASEVTSSSPDKAGSSASSSGSPSQAAGRQTPSGKPPPAVSAFACVGDQGTEVAKWGHACARQIIQDGAAELCFVGRVGDAPAGLSFFADKAMEVDDEGRVLVAHVSVRPTSKMPRDVFLGLLDSFFGTQCLKMKAAGAKDRSPRGRDDEFVKPLAVLPCPSTGDPKNASPHHMVLAPGAVVDRDLLQPTKHSAFARRSLTPLLNAT